MPVITVVDFGNKDKTVFVTFLMTEDGKATVIEIGELPIGKGNT